MERSIHIDSFGGWDLFALILGAALLGMNTLIVLYTLYQRKYPPLRAKNIKLVLVLYASIVIWYIGSIGTNLNMRAFHTFNNSCVVYASWLRVLFGMFLFIFVHILRLYLYIRIFNKVKKITIWCYVVPAIIYVVIVLGFGLPATLLQSSLSVQYIQSLGVCTYGTAFKEISFAVVWLGWLGVLLAAFLARNINTSFNEFREMVLICVVTSIAIAYLSILHHIVSNYIIITWARVTTTMFEYLGCQTSLAILLGVPVYNCIFHHDEYKRRFYEKMRSDGMVSRYRLTMERSEVSTTITVLPSQLEEPQK
ncbi:hypothetical protein GQ54DRAFT_265066 [Martensiomyces pterosporus]|nr:hypothetical protein GQ54DRAFT_265066 [Martensiomyces pterosporus]